jgi:SWI/SNF-related matrix-associated actin-dependent regulator 1 of chromatin subfamily A
MMKHQIDAQSLLKDPFTPNVLVAFQPGLGKSRTVIEALTTSAHFPVLVVCPAIARDNWRNEFKLWSHPKIHGSPDPTQPSFLTIVSYDHLSNLEPGHSTLNKTKWGTIILDECHRLKNLNAKRTKFVYGHRAKNQGPTALVHNAKRVWLLSGTPAPNHVGELYPHLRALWPDLITLPLVSTGPMGLMEFEDRYCSVTNSYFGRQIVGSRNVKELKELIKKVSIFRREDQCLDLPPLDIQVYPLPHDDIPKRELKAIDDALNNVVSQMEHAQDPIKTLSTLGLHNAIERHILGVLKAPLASDLIYNDLVNDPDPQAKALVFFHHREVGKILHRILTSRALNPVLIDGSTPSKQRTLNIEKFQTNPKVRVMIAQMTAAGEAVNLTKGREVYLVEPSWVPKDNYQAIKRAHRIGQARSVRARFLTIGGSHDDKIMRTVAKKTKDLLPLYADEKESESAA